MTTAPAKPFTRSPAQHPTAMSIGARARDGFDNLNIVQKLTICFASILLLTVIIGAAGYWGIAKVDGNARVNGQLASAASLTSQLSIDMTKAQLHAERYKATGSAKELEQAQHNLKKVEQDLANAVALPELNSGDRMRHLGALGGVLQSYQDALAALEANREPGSGMALTRSGDEMVRGAQRIKDSLDQELATALNDMGTFMYWLRLVTIGLVAVWVVNAVSVAHRVARDITSRIKRVTAAMLRLADGDNEIDVPDLHRADEFGDMARSLDTFRRGYLKLDRLRNEQVEQQREKEEMRAQQAAVLLELADQFERTVGEVVGSVASASSQLQLTASSMATAAEHASLQTSEVSAALNEASGGVTAAAAASDEFAMSIGEISRQAATSADLARKATVSAADADATILALSDSAQQVGQIVELISTIAQRTNLLALNASIEAARGGEAGRGFAVVASEVKELAAQTSKATDAVAQQIRAIQDSTGASVTALRTIGQQVQQLEATSVSIAAAVDQQSVAGQDLARSIDLAARSTDEVSSNIVQVRETSLATGAAASQVLTSSTELEQQAATLKAQVEQFLRHVRVA